jgi:hypothetical protein
MAANDRIGEVHALDLGLQLAMVQLGDPAAEDRGDLVRLADSPIGVEEPFAELVEGGATMKNQVVAEFGLGEEQPVPATGLFALLRGEEWGEAGQPLLAAGDEIARGEFVSQFLQALGVGARHEGVRTLAEVDALRAQAIGQPMMLVEAEACGERQVGAHAHEHAAPSPVVDVEIVLDDPALGELQMPTVAGSVADGDQDAGGFARLQHDDDLVRLGTPEVRFDEFVAAAFRRIHNWDVVLCRPRLQPLLKAIGDAMQDPPAHRIQLSVGVEKPDHSLRLLKRLDQSVEQDPVEAAIVETNAILVVLIEGVHGKPPSR